MWPDNTIASLSHSHSVCASDSPRVVWYSSPCAASQTSSWRGAAPTVRCSARRATRSESSIFGERDGTSHFDPSGRGPPIERVLGPCKSLKPKGRYLAERVPCQAEARECRGRAKAGDWE